MTNGVGFSDGMKDGRVEEEEEEEEGRDEKGRMRGLFITKTRSCCTYLSMDTALGVLHFVTLLLDTCHGHKTRIAHISHFTFHFGKYSLLFFRSFSSSLVSLLSTTNQLCCAQLERERDSTCIFSRLPSPIPLLLGSSIHPHPNALTLSCFCPPCKQFGCLLSAELKNSPQKDYLASSPFTSRHRTAQPTGHIALVFVGQQAECDERDVVHSPSFIRSFCLTSASTGLV